MNNLPIQQFLRQHGAKAIEDQYGVKVKTHPQYPNLKLFKYCQINSPKNEITNNARGIILDAHDNWNVVAHGFDRFFNLGEGHAAEIDWVSALIEEKLDGSLMVMYYLNQFQRWEVASSGLPDGGGTVNGSSWTFADLFWSTFKHLDYNLPHISPQDRRYFDGDSRDLVFCFELMTRYNQVVVEHEKPRLVLIGARDRKYGDEEDPRDIVNAFGLNWEIAKTFPLTLNNIREAANSLDGRKQEGFVVRDENFNRIKVKGDDYVLLHHVKSAWTPYNCAMIALTNEIEEFIVHYPEYADDVKRVKADIEINVSAINSLYQSLDGITDQKEFAKHVMQFPDNERAIYFALRNGKATSVLDYMVNQMNDKRRDQLFKSWDLYS